MSMYSNEEYADMHLAYGAAWRNMERFLGRHPSSQDFKTVYPRLRDTQENILLPTILQLLTPPSLYNLETTLFCMSKCAMTNGRDIHVYGTRGRDNYRTSRHRTVVYERLPP
ncbi:hypothetical protein J6590_060680 [Homalodisca vitripennis]|nr:hypothetical protein J6590_060680 [Homalodisca vitripennis]